MMMIRSHRLVLAAAGAVAAGLGGGPAAAQDARLQTIQREIQEMRRQYDAQLEQMRRDYETRLQEMEQRLKTTESTAASAASQASQATQAASQASAAPPAATPSATAASASAFNPAIGLVLDGKYGIFSKNPATYRIPGFALGDSATPGERGFALGESELNFSANIDPTLYGNLTLAVERQGTVSVEEAFIQTTSLPYGFTVRAGRFFSGIGYMNEQHAHTWDFADTALPYRAFLNTQYDDDGVQLRWLAPTDFFLEFGTEAFRGDAFPAGGPASRFAGSYSGFAHAGADLNESSSVRGGVSYLHTKAAERATGPTPDVFTGDGDLWIFDGIYKWAPNGNPVNTNFKLQGEYFLRNENGTFNSLAYSGQQTGWYLQGVYQFMPQWRIGLRHDEVHASDAGLLFAGTALDTLGGVTPERNSVMLDYSTSEFGRFRAQYNNDQSRPKTDHQFLLQYTVSFGAHGAHQY
jgi:hypothetical protein